MLQKLKILYFRHFKLVGALGFCLSLYFINLFVIKGFDKINLYNLAVFFKLLGYCTTLGIEKLFFSSRSFYYKNLGFSYRRILGTLFLVDFAIFLLLLLTSWLWMSFI